MNSLIFYGIFLAALTVFMVVLYDDYRNKYQNLFTVLLNDLRLQRLNKKHVLGIILFMLPVILNRSQNFTYLQFHFQNYVVYGVTVLLALLLGFSAFVSAINDHKTLVQQSDFLSTPTKFRDALFYLLLRCVFLCCYEWLFRGAFLMQLVFDFSWPVAILLNTFVYVVAHSFSNRKELIGSIPFGIATCTLVLYSGSIIPAIILHLSLAMSYEGFLMYQKATVAKQLRTAPK